ncbi:MAG: LamG-like jellyroll fold domain-containing protein [Actinoallomurus sp.]
MPHESLQGIAATGYGRRRLSGRAQNPGSSPSAPATTLTRATGFAHSPLCEDEQRRDERHPIRWLTPASRPRRSAFSTAHRPTSTSMAGPSLNDGQWHTIICHKTANQVTLAVDGTQVGTANVTVGSITFKTNAVFAIGYNPSPEAPTATSTTASCANVSVAIGQSRPPRRWRAR